MCEWAYVIDFDTRMFEVFKGFNSAPVVKGRFLSNDAALEKSQGYEPVTLVRSYPLDALPTETAFLAELEPTEEA